LKPYLSRFSEKEANLFFKQGSVHQCFFIGGKNKCCNCHLNNYQTGNLVKPFICPILAPLKQNELSTMKEIAVAIPTRKQVVCSCFLLIVAAVYMLSYLQHATLSGI
jgi:hypothetical protein